MILEGCDSDYRVIADATAPIEIGDTVTYEPDGENFGWFLSKLS